MQELISECILRVRGYDAHLNTVLTVDGKSACRPATNDSVSLSMLTCSGAWGAVVIVEM